MEIAHIVCVFPPYKGGIGNVAYNFAAELSRQGHKVAVLTPKYEESDLKSDLFKIKRYKPMLKYGNAAFLPQLLFELDKYDAVHFHYPFFGGTEAVWLAKLIHRSKIRLFIHYHMDAAGLPAFIRSLSWPAKIIFPFLARKAEYITCASLDYVKCSQIAGIYRKYGEKFIEIPFGVDLNKFFRDQDAPKTGRNILFVSALDKAHYFKGLELLFKSLANVKEQDWQLRIAGGGNMLRKYKDMAKQLGVNALFLGRINDDKLAEAYRKSDILVLPSINRNEAFGLVLLEAMASGTAVLASDLPGVRTVFTHREQGYYFKANCREDLTAKIKKMLAQKEETRQMGIKGRELAENKYDWKKIGKKLNNIYG